MKGLRERNSLTIVSAAIMALLTATVGRTIAADKPNIILILSDDFGYGDAGAYGGGPGRGMPTPNLDRLAAEGMTFFSFYAQPSCTPAAPQCRPAAFPTAAA